MLVMVVLPMHERECPPRPPPQEKKGIVLGFVGSTTYLLCRVSNLGASLKKRVIWLNDMIVRSFFFIFFIFLSDCCNK